MKAPAAAAHEALWARKMAALDAPHVHAPHLAALERFRERLAAARLGRFLRKGRSQSAARGDVCPDGRGDEAV